MSGPEVFIIYIAGALLLSITASRFLLQELIALILLFKKLRAVIKAPLPISLQPRDEDKIHSRRR